LFHILGFSCGSTRRGVVESAAGLIIYRMSIRWMDWVCAALIVGVVC
jgi:hypothetical protein